MEWLTNISYGHWWLLAGLLLILELASPTYFFLWLGIAAAAIGFLVIVFPSIPLEMQFIAFALLVVIAAYSWLRARKAGTSQSESGISSRD